MSNRIRRAKFRGKMVSVENGVKVPDRYIRGIPARDLTAEDIDAMDSATYEQLRASMKGDDPLYTDPDAGKKPAQKSTAKKSSGKSTSAKTTTTPKTTASRPTTPKDSGATPNADRIEGQVTTETANTPHNGVETPPTQG